MLVVTLLWSSSFPIHKMLLSEGMPPLSLAAYRYFSASVVLVVVLGLKSRCQAGAGASAQRFISGQWLALLGIGLFMYSAQGVHITALSLLSASDSGLVSMTFMPVAVAFLSAVVEKKPPTKWQVGGLCVILVGIYLYFPHDIGGARLAGVLLNVLSSSMWAVAVVLTHMVVNKPGMSSLKLTAVSMTTGSFLLLVAAVMHDRLYVPSFEHMLWLAFLVFVNTAFAFALYNHTLRVLGAFEAAALQDSMIVQIGLLSVVFLGETMSPVMILGMLVVVVGIAIVQYCAPASEVVAPSGGSVGSH